MFTLIYAWQNVTSRFEGEMLKTSSKKIKKLNILYFKKRQGF